MKTVKQVGDLLQKEHATAGVRFGSYQNIKSVIK